MKAKAKYIKGLVLAMYFILAGTALIVNHGCSSSKACSTTRKTAESPQPFLLFQKTPCYGVCPSYEASITANGSITFIGWEHVPVRDTLQLCLSPKDLATLRKEVQQLDYEALQNTYLTEWTDMPSTITTFYENGKQVKKVKHQEGGPDKLLQFQDKVHNMIMQLVEAAAKEKPSDR